MKKSEIANQLSLSSSTIQRYRNDINMLSPYRIQSNNINKRIKKAKNTNSDNDSQPNHDDKRPQMTSKQLKQNLIRKTNLFQKPDLCNRKLKLTNTIWMKIFIIITLKWN